MARAMVLMDEGEVLLPEHFPTAKAILIGTITLREQVKQFKVEMILTAVRHEGSMVRAPKQPGMSPRNLNKLCHRLGFSPLSDPKGSGLVPKGA